MALAHRVVADQRREVDRGASAGDAGERLADVERRAAAVAGHDRRHTHADEVLGERLALEIVCVRVHVDEAGCDDQARGVDDLARVLHGDGADGGDAILDDGDVGAPRRCARPVDHPAADDGKVIACRRPRLRQSQQHRDADRCNDSLHAVSARGRVIRLTSTPTTTTTMTPMGLCQRNEMPLVGGMKCHGRDDRHAGEQAHERPGAGRALESQRQHEDAEQGPVEKGPEPVDDLDQRAEAGRIDRDEAGDDAPEAGQQLRHAEIVRIARCRLQQPPIDVDDARRRQRVELRRNRRHRRREDRGDDQPDETRWQPRRDEGWKDVVDVRRRCITRPILVALVARNLAHQLRRAGAHRADLAVGRLEGRTRRPCRTVVGRRGERGGGRAACLEGRRELAFQLAELRRSLALFHPFRVHPVEQQRRLLKEVEDEDEHAGQQDERLQRDLDEGAHHQRVAPFLHGLRGQVALHLALVAAEIRQHQEQPAEQPGPEGVGLRPVEAEVDGSQAPRGAGHVQRIADAHLGRQPEDERDDDREQADDDDRHLLDVGPGHRLDAADHRVDRRRQADREDGQRQVPAEDDRENHGGRGDDHAARQPARAEEQHARQGPCLQIEAALEVLVGGVDAGAVEERHERHAEDDHRDRQPEVELHEAHAVGVALPGRPDQRDRAQLRRHHREADGPPRQAAVREQIAFDLVRVLGAADAVPHHPHQVEADDDPIEQVHASAVDAAEEPEGGDGEDFTQDHGRVHTAG